MYEYFISYCIEFNDGYSYFNDVLKLEDEITYEDIKDFEKRKMKKLNGSIVRILNFVLMNEENLDDEEYEDEEDEEEYEPIKRTSGKEIPAYESRY